MKNGKMKINKEIKVLKDVRTAEDGVIWFTDLDKTREELTVIADKYKDLLVREDNLKESNDAVVEIGTVINDLQYIQNHNSKLLMDMIKDHNETVKGLADILVPHGERLSKAVVTLETQISRHQFVLENYNYLLEAMKALGGDIEPLLRDYYNPATEEDVDVVRKEIKKLSKAKNV